MFLVKGTYGEFDATENQKPKNSRKIEYKFIQKLIILPDLRLMQRAIALITKNKL